VTLRHVSGPNPAEVRPSREFSRKAGLQSPALRTMHDHHIPSEATYFQYCRQIIISESCYTSRPMGNLDTFGQRRSAILLWGNEGILVQRRRTVYPTPKRVFLAGIDGTKIPAFGFPPAMDFSTISRGRTGFQPVRCKPHSHAKKDKRDPVPHGRER